MDRERKAALILERREKIRRLSSALSRATCDGAKYSLPEDVEIVEEIERLEAEISELERGGGADGAASRPR
ncbi:MAG: hypothetical protein PHN82_08305 [bacterium]|nr:hypothetical protein [bacterium]